MEVQYAASTLLSRWHSNTTGEIKEALCWQTAMAVDSLVELARLLPHADQMRSRIAGALNATFALIPNRNASKPPCNKQQILDDNYDDQAWFALAWLSYADSDLLLPAASAASVRAAAVGRAVQIFENMARKAWDERHCGGGCWKGNLTKDDRYKNTITNVQVRRRPPNPRPRSSLRSLRSF